MFNQVVAHMHAKYCNINIYISFVFLVALVEMVYQEPYQTCEDLACQNSNACQSSLNNGTPESHAHCACRGQWAGMRCEVKLIVSTPLVTTEKVTLEMRGLTSSGRGKLLTFEDLRMSKISVAVWNLNTSDQCLLLLQKDPTESVVSLGGLLRDQDYLGCITNGFVDSCSFFSYQVSNISGSTNCVYFRTRLFDEPPFDLGLVAVPCAVLIFLLAVAALVYSQRHSLLVQLCLNKVCCRSCYCCRRQRIQRRRRLMHKHRDMSAEGLVTPDLPLDFESLSASQSGPAGDSSHRTHSSDVSPSASHRSAYSLDGGSTAHSASLDRTFLYEDQSLIPPLYSPQDHKVMTLTFIDEDFVSIAPGHTDCPTPPLPYLYDPASNGLPCTQDITNCRFPKHKVPDSGSVVQKKTGNGYLGMPDSNPHTGPVKPQHLIHPYLHRPYDKTHVVHRQAHPRRQRNRSSNSDSLGPREPNQPALHQRPCSLPLTHNLNAPSANGAAHPSLFDSPRLQLPIARLKNSHNSFHPAVSSCSTIMPSSDNTLRPLLATKPSRLNHLLSSPSRYTTFFRRDRHINVAAHSCDSEDRDEYSSNTLPRSRKPRFAVTYPKNIVPADLPGCEHASEKPCLFVKPNSANNTDNFWLRFDSSFKLGLPQTVDGLTDCWHKNQSSFNCPSFSVLPHAPSHTSNTSLTSTPQKPAWLDIPLRDKDLNFDAQSVSSTSTAAGTSSSSLHKSYNKHVKNLISHFEHNLPFLKSSKCHRATDEEMEFRDLQSPLAEERRKVSKKSRRSGVSRSRGSASLITQSHRLSLPSGVHIFDGHPSDHILLPFSNDDRDNDDDDVTETSTLNDISDETLSTSLTSASTQNVISCYDGDDSNLVTPFVTDDDSSSDDTYKDINSLSESMETLQDDNVGAGHSLLSYQAVPQDQPLL